MGLIYLIGIVDAVKELMVTGSIVFLIILLFAVCVAIMEFDYKPKQWVPLLVGFLFLNMALSVFIPSSKTIAAMYLIPKIAPNEKIINLPDKVIDILNLKLDEYLRDLKKDE